MIRRFVPSGTESAESGMIGLAILLVFDLLGFLLHRYGHLPLPVLGIPGWWPENEKEDFYDDAAVFRPARG